MTERDPSEDVINRVAELLRTAVGLRPESTLRARLRRSIRDEIVLLELDSDGYPEALAHDSELRQRLLNRVTVQETGFFRHPEQFDMLARAILPSVPSPVTLWSAGCANGQEAFSLAMVLEENGIEGSVVATDVSTSALQRTRAASYSTREIAGLSPERVARHLRPVGAAWEVVPALRARVSTLHHNLIEPLPARIQPARIVFCRNVLIYFSRQHARDFLDTVAEALPLAWLILGATETVRGVGERYETLRIGDSYAYRSFRVPDATPAGAAKRMPMRTPASSAPRAQPIPDLLPIPVPVAAEDGADLAPIIAGLVLTGQRALAEHDQGGAVVIFRKWAYLAPDDPIAHLHLGLAFEAAGDRTSARRAFGAARRALPDSSSGMIPQGLEGYAPAELRKLLDSRLSGATRRDGTEHDRTRR
ncbi:protein-glutamate O-methyltransferase CheR [Cryobacterium sp. GrIS_2_6]|uniref:CheR family methyltransferase n=1 Tax=Cryobacterium sp. GrIS_2_6 TaxID=3162785 RepID=UPI002DFB73D6|nr:chemotaxis protein methyltransferase CheR [Cryobacterium psychrotolerans]